MNRPPPEPGRDPVLDPETSRWLDGAATPDEARRVEARLAADPRLAAEVERLRADLDLFRRDVRPREDAGLADRVLAAVAEGDPGASEVERFRRAARRWAAAAAVLAALGVGGSIAVDGVSPPPTAAPESLTSVVESDRLTLEVDLALDQRPVAPTDK